MNEWDAGICCTSCRQSIWSSLVTLILAHNAKQKIDWMTAGHSESSSVGAFVGQGVSVLPLPYPAY